MRRADRQLMRRAGLTLLAYWLAMYACAHVDTGRCVPISDGCASQADGGKGARHE